jgi:nitronate monooxygenase
MRWPENRLTKLLQIDYPIIQGPMAGGPSTPQLVAAVSNSGGLGSLGAGYLTPPQIREAIRTVKSLTSRPFNVSLFIPSPPAEVEETRARVEQVRGLMQPYLEELGLPPLPATLPPPEPSFDEQLEVILAEQVPVFSVTFGIIPADWTKRLKSAGVKLMATATTVNEALAQEEAGVDVVVGQGSEAGGHRGTFQLEAEKALIGTMALIPQMVDRVQVPVVAAGGIMDGRGIVAAMVLGASGAQLGTAFLTTPESGASAPYKQAVLASTEESTAITRAFSGRAARGIRNRFSEGMRPYDLSLPPYPVQNSLTRELRQVSARHNSAEYLSLWAGQATRLITTLPASELMARLIGQVETVLGQFQTN